MHEEGSNRAIIAALLANLGIALAKLVGFIFTGAASMLAECIHSVADTGNQGLLLLGGRLSKKQADETHPFGYSREKFFWAFVVSMVLFSLGSLFALYEGFHKLLGEQHELESPVWAIAILGVAVVLEGFSLRTAIHESRPMKGDMGWFQFIRRTKRPELATVLLEDTGALLGLVFALLGVSLAALTGDARFDAVGSIAIGLLLGAIACILARENKSLLIGEAADPAEVQAITAAIEGGAGVQRLIHLRTLQLGPDDMLVAAKVDFGAATDASTISTHIDAIEKRIRAEVATARLIFIEPDTYDAALAATPEPAPAD